MSDKQDTEIEHVTETAPQLVGPEVIWRLDERKALALSKASNALPRAYAGKPADILAAWMLGDELGIPRMSMLRGAYVVNGKPQLSGDLLMAVAHANGVKVTEWSETDDEGEAIAYCKATRRTGDEYTESFSVSDAKRAGLWDSSDVWKKYPARMLKMRARGFCLRDAIPELLAGVYAPGEVIDVTPEDVQ